MVGNVFFRDEGRGRLADAHMRPLMVRIEAWRSLGQDVPNDAGINAGALFVLETPGPSARHHRGRRASVSRWRYDRWTCGAIQCIGRPPAE